MDEEAVVLVDILLPASDALDALELDFSQAGSQCMVGAGDVTDESGLRKPRAHPKLR